MIPLPNPLLSTAAAARPRDVAVQVSFLEYMVRRLSEVGIHTAICGCNRLQDSTARVSTNCKSGVFPEGQHLAPYLPQSNTPLPTLTVSKCHLRSSASISCSLLAERALPTWHRAFPAAFSTAQVPRVGSPCPPGCGTLLSSLHCWPPMTASSRKRTTR